MTLRKQDTDTPRSLLNHQRIDIIVPSEKPGIIAEADKKVEEIENEYRMGLSPTRSAQPRYQCVDEYE